ncbi:MAG: cytochrome c biogenesis protein ResB [Gemmataceae bacterium]
MSIAEQPAARTRRAAANPVWQAIKAIASLRLTVVLFVLSMFLVFVGTLAQLNDGVWTVVDRYFRSVYVWVPVQLFVQLGQVFLGVPPTYRLSLAFPFPGGITLGTLLLVNILAAHATRFRLTWKRAGVLIVHTGLIVLFVGEAVLWFADDVEARMTMAEGETVNYLEMSRKVELAMTDSSDPKSDDVVVVPGTMLRDNLGKVIANKDLPVDIRVDEYAENSDLMEAGMATGPDVFTTSIGRRVRLSTRKEGTGVDTGAHDDAALVRVTLLEKGTTKEIGTYVVSLWLQPNFTSRLPRYAFAPQSVPIGGKNYTIELRPKRAYRPYAMKLLEFRHDVYVGTDTPKNYSSEVRLTDPSEKEDREVLIRMNAPLRYRGETFYQSGVLQGQKGTVLQVVRNPGWTLPYIACALVTFGMLWHFGIMLSEFLARRVSA